MVGEVTRQPEDEPDAPVSPADIGDLTRTTPIERPSILDDNLEVTPPETTRLSVNLNREAGEALKEIAERRGMSITETVRRAIGALKFVENEIQQGKTIQTTDGKKVREIHFLF